MAIGSVGVEVVPDARAFWIKFQEQTGKGSHEVKVDVNADTTKARAQIDSLNKSTGKASFQAHALADALTLIGPALVPIGAVGVGALAGLVPLLATVGLGVKGLVNDYKSGALQASQFGGDVKDLQSELSKLEQISAGGLLVGLSQSMTSLRPAFAEVNRDTAVFAGQLGGILGSVAPGIVRLLTDLSPLFATLGTELQKGASKFETWATSTDSVSKFVAYVQTELPTVEHALGELIDLAGRLAAGLSPIGHVALSSIGVLAQTLNALPLDVLSKIESGAIAVYAAFRSYSAITAIVSSVNAALANQAVQQQRSALVATAAGAQVEAAAAQQAASVAAAAAAEAAATAEASVNIAASLEGTDSALAANATAAAEAAIEFSAAMDAEAAAAATAAETVSASAADAAAASTAAGEAAAVGWSSMLGPVGAVAIGVGVLASVFLHSSSTTQANTQAVNSYTEALLRSNGAIDDNIRAQAAKALGDEGALAAANRLGINLSTLTDASLGVASAQDVVSAALNKATGGGYAATAKAVSDLTAKQQKNIDDAATVQGAINGQSTAFGKAAEKAKLQAEAAKAANDATKSLASSSGGLAGELGLTETAYAAASAAAKKNAASTRQQTAAMQLANDAAGLLQQALDRLSGKKVSYAQVDNQFQQSLVTMAQGLKGGSKAIEGLSSAAIANRGNLLQLVTGAQAAAEAYGNMKGSTEAGRQKLVEMRKELIDNAVHFGANRTAVTNYIDSLLKIPKRLPPTELTVKDATALANIRFIKQQLAELPTYKTITVNEQTRGNLASTIRSQTHAAGGPLDDGFFTVGEAGWELGYKQGSKVDIFSNQQSQKMTGLPKQLPGYASGTGVVSLSPGSKGSGSSKTSVKLDFIVDGKHFASLKSAENAAISQSRANIKLGVQIERQGFASWKTALAGSVADAQKAFATIERDAQKLGISGKMAKSLEQQNKKLDAIVGQRNAIQTELGTPPSAPTAYDKLSTALDNLQQEASSVRDAMLSVFDITSAGTGPNGDQAVTGGAILAEQKQDAYRAKLFVADIKALSKKIPGAYLTELAQKGPDALPEAQALLSLSTSQLGTLRASSASITASSNSLASFVSQKDYGGSVASARADITNLKDRLHTDNQRIETRLQHMETRIANAVDKLATRPVYVTVNGKVVAKEVAKANKQLGRGK